MLQSPYLFKTAGLLPTNFMEWGTSIILELVERLPDIQSYIKDYRTVMQNNQGKGFGLVVLQGNKAFVPVFIDEWKTKPMDILIYKAGNEIKFKYLSKRSLIDLLITSGLDTKPSNPQGAKDNMINVFSPIGEYNTSGNPYYGLTSGATLSKTSSEFVYDLVSSYGMLKYASDDIVNIFLQEQPIKHPLPKYYLLSKEGSDYVMYIPQVAEDGTIISAKELHKLLPNDVPTRSKIASALEFGEIALIGSFRPRLGNVLVDLDETDSDRLREGSCKLEHDGLYYYDGEVWYINPNTVGLDQFQLDVKLGVTQGAYTLKSKYQGVQPKNTGTATLNQDDLIPEARTIDIGKTYAILNEKQNTITIPFKVLSKTITEDNKVTIGVLPVVGETEPQTIYFYNGEVVRKIKDNFYAYPLLYSRLVHIPENYYENSCTEMTSDFKDFVPVVMYYGGENLYTFIENTNDIKGPMSKGKAVFELINRYRMSLDQANALLRKLPYLSKISFRFKPITKPILKKDINQEMPLHEKQALHGIVKLAHAIDEFYNKYNIEEKEYILTPILKAMITKSAAGPEVNNPQTTDAEQRADANQMNIMGGATAQNPQLMMGLMKINTIDKPLRDVIDKIMFYYSGSIRKDQGIELLTELESAFLEIENKLGLAVMLTQIDQLPGQSYDELRILLADIDSFLTSLRGSQVLVRNV